MSARTVSPREKSSRRNGARLLLTSLLTATMIGGSSQRAMAGATLETTGAKVVITNDSWSGNGFAGNFVLHDTLCDSRGVSFRVQMWSSSRWGFADYYTRSYGQRCNIPKDYGKRTFNVAFGKVRGMTVTVCREGDFWHKTNCASHFYHP